MLDSGLGKQWMRVSAPCFRIYGLGSKRSMTLTLVQNRQKKNQEIFPHFLRWRVRDFCGEIFDSNRPERMVLRDIWDFPWNTVMIMRRKEEDKTGAGSVAHLFLLWWLALIKIKGGFSFSVKNPYMQNWGNESTPKPVRADRKRDQERFCSVFPWIQDAVGSLSATS